MLFDSFSFFDTLKFEKFLFLKIPQVGSIILRQLLRNTLVRYDNRLIWLVETEMQLDFIKEHFLICYIATFILTVNSI